MASVRTLSGIVTRPRRPPGWRAPGPAPAAPADRPELWPGPGEELCLLCGDWRLLQKRRGHRWSLDDLVTAAVAARVAADDPPARILDLGCGIGAVLLLLAWRFPEARCVGVEAQAASAALARRSIGWNGVEERCTVREGDLRDPATLAGEAAFALVTGTPPYLPLGTATPPSREEQPGCHLEQRGGIADYCAAAARALAPGGRFVVCHAWPDRARVEEAAEAAGLAVAERLDVVPREPKPPLFSVFTMRRRDEAPAGACSTLVVRDAGGEWTEAFRRLRADMGMPARPPERMIGA